MATRWAATMTAGWWTRTPRRAGDKPTGTLGCVTDRPNASAAPLSPAGTVVRSEPNSAVTASIIVANLMPLVITSVMLPTASSWVLADHFEHVSQR